VLTDSIPSISYIYSEVTRQDYRVELNKVFELESRIQVLREQLYDTDRKLALATDRNEALTQQITALGSDLQALKSIRDAQTSEGEMLQHQLMQHQVSIKALELQLNQYSQSEQHMVQCALRLATHPSTTSSP
jgi:chromosome segregation ATPase